MEVPENYRASVRRKKAPHPKIVGLISTIPIVVLKLSRWSEGAGGRPLGAWHIRWNGNSGAERPEMRMIESFKILRQK